MNAEALALLLETTLAGSAAALAVLALRRPLRTLFGAGAAYAAWGLVPAALLAVLVPAASTPVLPALAAAAPVLAPLPSAATAAVAGADPLRWVPLAWLLGAAFALVVQVRRQRRFHAGLGALRRRPDGLLQADASSGLPAVLGWPARIVLPGDFEQRYDAVERELVLCHESVHLRRGDLPASALVALLRCLFWFNPLVHYAAARFRHDQELACDAAVLRRYPESRRRYGDALLKTQLADEPLPVGCHWFGTHPLKERIVMLKKPLPSKSRWFAGVAVAVVLTVAGAVTAWAAQPATPLEPGPGQMLLSLSVRIDGGDPQPASAIVVAGGKHEFAFAADGQSWRLEVALQPLDDGRFDLTSRIHQDDRLLAEPRLIFGATGASMQIGEERGDAFDGIEIQVNARHGAAVAAGRAPADSSGVPYVTGIGAAPAEDLMPVLLEAPPPPFPAPTDDGQEYGTVVLHLQVDDHGRVTAADYSEDSTVAADSPLVQAARGAALRWHFEPAMKDGKPVASTVAVPVKFAPEAPAAAGGG